MYEASSDFFYALPVVSASQLETRSKAGRLRWLHTAHCCTCNALCEGPYLYNTVMKSKTRRFDPVMAAWDPVRFCFPVFPLLCPKNMPNVALRFPLHMHVSAKV